MPGAADVTNPYAFNRDGRVDTFDISICRNNRTTSLDALQRITVPAAPGGAGPQAAARGSLTNQSTTSGQLVDQAWRRMEWENGVNTQRTKTSRIGPAAVDAILADYYYVIKPRRRTV